MSAQTHTFPCPFCGRRMGVGFDLLGKHVRCPHCKQVVLAPATAAAPPAPPPAAAYVPPPPTEPVAVSPPPVAPPPAPVMYIPPEPLPLDPEPAPEPTFNLPREAADSILSDAHGAEDEVFGSHPGTRLPIPELPPPPVAYQPPPPPAYVPPPPAPIPAPAPAPAAAGSDPFAFDMSPPPAPLPPPPPPRHAPAPAPVAPAPAPTTAIPNPFDSFEPLPPPPPPPPPRHTPAPAAHGGPANPWAGLDAMPAPVTAPPAAYPAPAVAYPAPAPRPAPAPLPLPEPEPVVAEEAPAEKPSKKADRAARARPAAVPGGVPKAVVYGLAGYALLATGLAAYALFFRSPELPPEHPLSTIPDNFGEFDPASRKGDKGKANANRFKGDGDLPANLKAGLGGKIEVGQVEVEPLRVERRPLRLFAEKKNGEERVPTTGTALVLRLRVKNTSSDLTFSPLDPAFNRKTITNDDRPLTRLVVAGESYYGGPVNWPFRTTRQYDDEQRDDATPLKPGESREYSVCSATDAKLLAAVRKATDPVVWRVQVRRGVIEYREKEVPVTAVIGVEFKGSQVQ